MKSWRRIASGYNLNIPEEDLERLTPALDALEAVFRPLARAIPYDLEPAVVFRPAEDAA